MHKKCYHSWAECTRNSANGGDVTLDNQNHGNQQSRQNSTPNQGGGGFPNNSSGGQPNQTNGNGQQGFKRKFR